jgi:hypothetical protein
MKITEGDAAYIKNRISSAEAILVLGAGAVGGSRNSNGKSLKSGDELAAEICREAGKHYGKESLPVVLDALKLSAPQLNTRLVSEYQGCTASDELKSIFFVPWRRVYTFNIDDSIESIQGVLSKQVILACTRFG